MPALHSLAAIRTPTDLHVELRDGRLHRRDVGLILRVRRHVQHVSAIGTQRFDRNINSAVHVLGGRTTHGLMPAFAPRLLRMLRTLATREADRLTLRRPFGLFQPSRQFVVLLLKCCVLSRQHCVLLPKLLDHALQLHHASLKLTTLPTTTHRDTRPFHGPQSLPTRDTIAEDQLRRGNRELHVFKPKAGFANRTRCPNSPFSRAYAPEALAVVCMQKK